MASFILPIVSGLAGLFGGGRQQQQTGSYSGSQSGNQYQTTTPNLSPFQQSLANMFVGGAQSLYGHDTDLSGYTSSGLQNINQAANLQNKALQNIIASRGLSFSPAAATAETMGEQNRLNQSSQFLNQIPLLQRQLQQQGLQGLMQAFGTLPTGVSTSGGGTQSTSGNQVGNVYGNPLGGFFGGLGGGLSAPAGGAGLSNLGQILSLFGHGSPSFSPAAPVLNMPGSGFSSNPIGGYGTP